MKFVFIVTHKKSGYEQLCVGGNTKVVTPFGSYSIKDLTYKKKLDDTFLVYCYDFKQKDYTLGWATKPHLVKTDKVIEIAFEDGTSLTCTPDHKVLLKNGEWIEAGKMRVGNEAMTFHRIKPNQAFTKTKKKQFPRILTKRDGWKTERQFLDEWRANKKFERNEGFYKIIKAITAGLNTVQVADYIKVTWSAIAQKLRAEGFSYKEVQRLNAEYLDRKRVVGVFDKGEQEVYDLSVADHENFATDSAIVHNCSPFQENHYYASFPELIYTHPTDLNTLKAKDKYARGYVDAITTNYQFACPNLYKLCHFIYLLSPSEDSDYYRFRLRRMYEMALKTPNSLCVTWENINIIKEFMDLDKWNAKVKITTHDSAAYNKYLPLINNACSSKNGS